MGLVHGFFPTTENDPDGIVEWAQEPLNAGISVVVPLERVLDINRQPSVCRAERSCEDETECRTCASSCHSQRACGVVRFEDLGAGHVTIIKQGAEEVDRDHL